MDTGRAELRRVLLETRSLLVQPGNKFDWSSWEDAEAAFRELDGLVAALLRDCHCTWVSCRGAGHDLDDRSARG
jgi:hypothetical protein